MLPTVFLSHGAPYLSIVDSPARDFVRRLGDNFKQPKAILIISAHWETAQPTVNAVAVNPTIHDFRGFPAELHAIQYPAPGSPDLAQKILELLGAAGFSAKMDTSRGLDHGAWVPLILAYPKADIPVVQMSIQSALGPSHHFELGRAIGALRAEGVLIVGSGSYTHNLHEFFHADPQKVEEPEWVSAFSNWFDKALMENRTDDLLNYRQIAPYAERNHPTEEHLLPIFVALGASGDPHKTLRLHSSSDRGVLRLDAYAFQI